MHNKEFDSKFNLLKKLYSDKNSTSRHKNVCFCDKRFLV